MDLTVLDRQRATLQRQRHRHHHSTWQDNINHAAVCLSSADPIPPLSHQLPAATSNSNNSSVTRAPLPKSPHQQCNSNSNSSPLRKRKPEQLFDAAEDVVTAKGLKSEEFGEDDNSQLTAKTDRDNCSKVSEVQKPDYIHVRARRGQATDSHSLAERARREKISKKMKCLQDLVPGCNKVIGKAGMLDEIINYVQSLQKQVEFLSMKLAAINPRLDFSIDNFFAKEIPAYLATLQPSAAQFDGTSSICYQYPMQQGTSGFVPDMPLEHSLQPLTQKTGSAPIPDAFLDQSSSIAMSGWESDWPNLFNAGFH